MKDEWFYLDELNQAIGPFSSFEIKNRVMDSDIFVWKEGLEDWTPSSQCRELERKVYKLKSSPRSSRKSSNSLDEDGQPVTKGFNRANNISKAVNELIGVCKAILMDGVVSDEEAMFLRQWCEKHSDLVGEWPLSVLSKRIHEIFEDGVIDETERKDLKELIQQISGEKPDVGEVPNLATRLPFKTPEPEITFDGTEFCLTGKFLFGPRKKVAAEIESKGGEVGNSVTMGLDFLVIGTQSSRDWKNGNFGRKIERAVKYQNDDILTIVSEEHWASHL